MNEACSAPATTSQRFHPVRFCQACSHEASLPPGLCVACAPRKRNGRDSPLSGTGTIAVPSMFIPARSLESLSMAPTALAPPAE